MQETRKPQKEEKRSLEKKDTENMEMKKPNLHNAEFLRSAVKESDFPHDPLCMTCHTKPSFVTSCPVCNRMDTAPSRRRTLWTVLAQRSGENSDSGFADAKSV